MKILKGGLILLNICALSLTVNGVAQTVTNEEVKKELSNLQMYIDDDATFTKQPKVGFKPVLLQYRSSASKINGVMMCKMGFDITNKKLIISGVDGEKLSIQIECVFIDNPEDVKVTPYVLQSATITAYRGIIGDLDILGDLVVDGDLTVDGITSKGIANTGGLGNIGNVAISGDLSVSGSINGEEEPSIKPIYCHPITLSYNRTTDSRIITLTMLIFNNVAQPFTKQTFVDWLKEFFTNNENGRIMVSGYAGDKAVSYLSVANYDPSIQCLLNTANLDASGTNYYLAYSSFLAETTIFIDGVNKIN